MLNPQYLAAAPCGPSIGRKKLMRKLLVLVALAPGLAFGAISSTKHNLTSAAAAGQIAFNTTELCGFCHVPHNANTTLALWARGAPSGTGYNVTTQTTAGTPLPASNASIGTGSQRCLSCHDGTVGLNVSLGLSPAPTLARDTTPPHTAAGGGGVALASGYAYFGTLENQHPVGIPYPGNAASRAATAEYGSASTTGCAAGIALCVTGGANTNGQYIKLSGTTAANATLECSSCHEPHKSTPALFLRIDPASAANAVCGACHIK